MKLDNIKITRYDHKIMFEQVKNLFILEYGIEDIGINGEFFEKFYNSEFQANKSINLVALDGDIVCGFQAFFYWPYFYKNIPINSYQSGNSLVAPGYRGRGIFSQLLSYIEDKNNFDEPIDLIIGFPVEMSYNSFIKKGWAHPFDLAWHIKFISFLSVLSKKNIDLNHFGFSEVNKNINPVSDSIGFYLSKDRDFEQWRSSIRAHRNKKVYYYYYQNNGSTIKFEVKLKIRGRIKELIIGDIIFNNDEVDFIEKGISELIKSISNANISIATICLNESYHDQKIIEILKKNYFLKISKKIYFINKNLNAKIEGGNKKMWRLFMSDIDTW